MKNKTLHSLLASAVLACTAAHASELIIMPFNGTEAEVAQNLGTLPDGTIGSSNRPKPVKVSPGVGGSGQAIRFTNEQTGRPDYYQSIDIESDGLDNLSAFTVTLWFKSDASQFNPSNPIGKNLVTILLDSTDGTVNNSAGLKVGLNRGETGEQVYVYLSDGSTMKQNWFGFAPRPNPRDGQWTFLAITFDAADENAQLRIYGGDEVMMTAKVGAYDNLKGVSGTGSSTANRISIGDGQRPFGNSSSHIGLLDGIYITDYAMDFEQIEAIRSASLR